MGDYNRSNVLTAAALAEASGVPHATIQAVIPTLKPRWGRLERVENPNVAAEVFVDFAHTPDGLEKVLAAARGFTRGELWAVFGAGGDRDPMKRPLMGEACARLADRLVVTSDNPRSEDPMKIIEAIVKGIEGSRVQGFKGSRGQGGEGSRVQGIEGTKVQGDAVVIEPDRKAAIVYALRNAKAGDVVIIAGKGHETTQEIRGVKHPFDDREVVRQFAG